MSYADLDGLCLQKILEALPTALELATMERVARPRPNHTTPAMESERRVRAMRIKTPDRQIILPEKRWVALPIYDIPTTEPLRPLPPSIKENGGGWLQDAEALLQRAVSHAGGWHAFLAARQGLLDTLPPPDVPDPLDTAEPTGSTIEEHPLLLWEIQRNGVAMHTELIPLYLGSTKRRGPARFMPVCSPLGDSCEPYTTSWDEDGASVNENGPVNKDAGDDRFQISVPASDRAIWRVRISMLAPDTLGCLGGCAETLMFEVDFDTSVFAASPQGKFPKEMHPHLKGGSGHFSSRGEYQFTLLTHFDHAFDFDICESDEDDEDPDEESMLDLEVRSHSRADDPCPSTHASLSPCDRRRALARSQLHAIVDHNEEWESTRIHLSYVLSMNDPWHAIIPCGNMAPRRLMTAEKARAAAEAEGLELVRDEINPSGYRNVFYDSSGKRETFAAKATVDGIHRYFGTFANAEHAALACARGFAAAARRAAATPERDRHFLH